MILKWCNWLILAAFVLSFYVWQQTQSIRLGYKVDGVKKECERWSQENKDLRLQVNCLLSMERLDRVAKERSLVCPDGKSTIYLPG